MAHCIITGGSRGIGRAIALALAAERWSLSLFYANDEAAADAACAAASAAGAARVQAMRVDVADAAQVAAAVAKAETELGAITGLVCNAGIMRTQFTAMTSPDDWRAVHAANLDGAFYCTKAVIRGMLRQKTGRIVYVSSDAALLGDLMRAAYSSSKAGMLGLMRAVARELAASGITVNAVAPGIIETAMTAAIPETRRAKQLAAIPMGRFGAPEEVARVVRFLLSEEAAFITGQTISVDGGLRM